MLKLSLSFLLLVSGQVHDTWSEFRGDGTSIAQAQGLPSRWSPQEGIVWKSSLPGYGQSSPLLWKGRIFLTSVAGPNKETCIISAWDLGSGKMLWEKKYPSSQKLKAGPMTSRAAPTGVVDAERVVCLFETGDLIALDHTGAELWKRSLTQEMGPWENNHGLASSLTQDRDQIFVLVEHRGPASYLMAIHKSTGRTTWKVDRKPQSSWTSPVVAKVMDRMTLLVSSPGVLQGFDPVSGQLLWVLEGLTGNNIPSPVSVDGLVVVGAGENRMKPDAAATAQSNCAIRFTSEGPKKSWGTAKVISQHASPLVHRGVVYFTTRSGMVHAHNLEDGKECFVERLAEPCWATPVGAGDLVFFFGKNGNTTVLKAGPTGGKVRVNRLWDESDFQRRLEEEKKKPENQLSFGQGQPGGGAGGPGRGQPKSGPGPQNENQEKKSAQPTPPRIPPEQARSMGYEAVGDVVYGVAAADGVWILRTGTEMICIRHGAK